MVYTDARDLFQKEVFTNDTVTLGSKATVSLSAPTLDQQPPFK